MSFVLFLAVLVHPPTTGKSPEWGPFFVHPPTTIPGRNRDRILGGASLVWFCPRQQALLFYRQASFQQLFVHGVEEWMGLRIREYTRWLLFYQVIDKD